MGRGLTLLVAIAWVVGCGEGSDAGRDAFDARDDAAAQADGRADAAGFDALSDALPEGDSDAPHPTDVSADADLPAPRVDPPAPTGPYAGYAVLGNGRISAAYGEPSASAGAGDQAPGLGHLFVGSFAFDAVEVGRTRLYVGGSEVTGGAVGIEPFFAAHRAVDLPGGGHAEWRTFVGAADAVVVQGTVTAGGQALSVRVVAEVRLRASPHLDGGVSVAAVERADAADRAELLGRFDDGTTLALGASPSSAALAATASGVDLALPVDLALAAGATAPFRWALAVGQGVDAARGTLAEVLAQPDALAGATAHWASFAPATLCEVDPRCTLAAANLYAARASSLGGQVPADLTGQFVTNGHPQLYPRDALMVARALHLGGHDAEAWEIVRDWLDSERPGPPLSDGQARAPGWYGAWYARYDALGRAVDAGRGAAYDVPEWDSNAYLAVLVDELGAGSLTADEQQKVLAALDWLVAKQDADGLWPEGGIIEWVGRLPGTAMVAWAGLDAGARLADGWGLASRATQYRAAAGRLRAGLLRVLFDLRRLTLADLRDGGLYYDTSLLFGPVWGYPVDPLARASLAFARSEASALGGGVRYFESPPGHPASGYGQDLFHFTTAGAAQVALQLGQVSEATALVDWMVAHTNRYGLAPERVFSDGSGAAPASPLSWCAAEVATTLRAWLARPVEAPLPKVDGVIEPGEYLPRGAVVLDADGGPDAPAAPVALYAARDGTTLWLGLRLASWIDPSTRPYPWPDYRVYLADAGGTGPVVTTGTHRLDFRTVDPDAPPGALARLELGFDGFGAGCTAFGTGGGAPCLDAAVGPSALEAAVDLASIGIPGPVQVIVASESAGDEQLLPAGGALQTDLAPTSVLVTFEVELAGVVGLDPPAGRTPVLVGDRSALGAWDPTVMDLFDDGSHGDRVASDEVWSRAVRLDERGQVAYKYVLRTPGGDPWAGVEFEGDNRQQWVQDVDDTGRVRIHDTFGVRGGTLLDW
jgi:hypothetical protein